MTTHHDAPSGASTELWNHDLAPTTAAQRTWRWYHFAALWVGMVISIPAYMLAASLIESGMSAWQQGTMRGHIGRVFVTPGWVSNLTVRENILLAQRHHTQRPDGEIGTLFALPEIVGA